jgi:hypothetical protein
MISRKNTYQTIQPTSSFCLLVVVDARTTQAFDHRVRTKLPTSQRQQIMKRHGKLQQGQQSGKIDPNKTTTAKR